MSNFKLDQKTSVGFKEAVNTPTKVQRKFHTSATPEGSILEELMDFASSIPDFRGTGKGNHRHKLSDIIILMIFARMSKCTGRADIIELGKHNLNKFWSLNLLKNGVPSEPTLCRVENSIDAAVFYNRMAEFAQSFYAELVKTCAFIEIICIDGKAMRRAV